MRLFKKKTLGAGAILLVLFASVWLWVIIRARPPLTMTLTGFVTNSYTAFAGEYVCAIMTVTNASDEMTFRCRPSAPAKSVHPLYADGARSGGTQTNYYAYRDGGFQTRIVAPHSAFSFEVAIFGKEMTNEIALDVAPDSSPAWLGRHIPVAIREKLPAFLAEDPKDKRFVMTTMAIIEQRPAK